MDVKKDARNRVVLPAAEFEHYHLTMFDDGHLELHPRVLAVPTVSLRTLGMMDSAMEHFARGKVSAPVYPDAMLAALGED